MSVNDALLYASKPFTSGIRPRSSLYIALLRMSDIVLPIMMLYMTHMVLLKSWGEQYTVFGIVAGSLFGLVSQFIGAYENCRGRSISDALRLVTKCWLMTLLMLAAMLFVFKVSIAYSRLLISVWSIATLGLLSIQRYTLWKILHYMFSRGINVKKVAIAGAGKVGLYLANVFEKNPHLGYRVVGLYDDNQDAERQMAAGFKFLGDTGRISKDAIAGRFDELFLALPLSAGTRIFELLEQLTNSTVVVKYAPDLLAFDLLHANWTDVNGLPVISVYDTPMSANMTRVFKRIEDIILSSLILFFIWPFMILIAIGVKLSSPGPVFYRQTRVGWNGKPFMILKFRSMPVDVEKQKVEWGGASAKQKTLFGQFIRSTSIDELPQFINVLKGDMSIVGPRPERDLFIEQISREVPRYMQRHMVKSGITGWAQINGWRGDTSLKKRVEYDLHYISNWSLWFDLKIIFMTAFKGWVNKNAC